MLGGFQSILTGITGARAPVLLALGLLIALASPSAAQPPRTQPDPTGLPIAIAPPVEPPAGTRGEPRVAPDVRVSTSPGLEMLPAPGLSSELPARPLAASAKPLTRAAARQRLETASPTAWLARFGNVTIERRGD